MAKKSKVIQAASVADNKGPTVIGTFTGKACETDFFNNNDMNLSLELFQKLMDSEEYKNAMAHRYYIGFLGHPEDPNCMDFRNACIVMTEMHLEGKDVIATFDLIDTPVGQVVKSFIDAGVDFGISIRGAGDVDSQGNVDPDTFVFRGYDLVTFPAYDDCIPEFQAIAASSDLDKQVKYKKVCASVRRNMKSITSCNALETIKEQFRESDALVPEIDARIVELSDEEDIEKAVEEQKISSLTDLYIDTLNEKNALEQELAAAQISANRSELMCNRRIASIKRIVSAQIRDLEDENRRVVEASQSLKIKLRDEKAKSAEVSHQLVTASRKIERLESRIEATSRKLLETSQERDSVSQDLEAKSRQLVTASEQLKNSNLKYNQKMQSHDAELSERDATIESLNQQLSETVAASKQIESRLSDLDDQVQELQSRVVASDQLVAEYQQAYANMYANALGIHLDRLSITSTTSVKQLRDLISASTSTSGMFPGNVMGDLIEDEYEDDIEFESPDGDDSHLVTM